MLKNLKLGTIATATLIFGLSGCSVKQDTQVNEKVVELQKQIESKDAKILQLEKSATKDTLLPLNAKAGECYTKVIIPAEYETKELEQLIKESETKIDVIPATYKIVQKKVQVRAESVKLIPVPATYKIETEKVMVEPEKTILEEVPATYKTVTEKILVKPAYTTWEKGRGEIEKIDTLTGEIVCLVEVPAVYKTVERTIIDTPATTKEIKIPAIYKTIEKRVVDTPATTREVKIPGICKMVDIEEIDTPAREVKTEIPAVYTTVKTEVKVSEPDFKWEPILCETNSTPDLISSLQSILKEKGYKISKIDGVYNKETQKAVSSYQEQNNLVKGALTIETLKHLNLQ